MTPFRLALVLVTLMALAACASSSPPVTYFLLRGEPLEHDGPVEARLRVGIGRIVVAPYLLSSKGVMVETGAGEITPAGQYQWAEPLDAGLRWYLRSEVIRELGREIANGGVDRAKWDYTVNITIARLHGTMAGEALIEAAFSVVPSDRAEEITAYRLAKSVPLEADGYASLVEAEKRLASELAGLIADALRQKLGS